LKKERRIWEKGRRDARRTKGGCRGEGGKVELSYGEVGRVYPPHEKR